MKGSAQGTHRAHWGCAGMSRSPYGLLLVSKRACHAECRACHTEYTPAVQNTHLPYRIHACLTEYTPATQTTPCHTEYMPATQNTRLPHRIHACHTECTPVTPHRIHAFRTEYTPAIQNTRSGTHKGCVLGGVGVALGGRGVATRIRKNPTRRNTQHNNILGRLKGGPNFSF